MCMDEMIFLGACASLVCGFFGWFAWVHNDRHPERLDRLRAAWRPVNSLDHHE